MSTVVYKKAAMKGLAKAPAGVRRRLTDGFERIAADQSTGLDIKPLQGRDGYRLRVGAYRALYRIDKNGQCIVVVVNIGSRGDVYK